MRCRWYALCREEAYLAVKHPILGTVPTCHFCADKHELEGMILQDAVLDKWEAAYKLWEDGKAPSPSPSDLATMFTEATGMKLTNVEEQEILANIIWDLEQDGRELSEIARLVLGVMA